jgi:hypothetical protein
MTAGAAGGLLATIAMTSFQAAWSGVAAHPPVHGTPESQKDPRDEPATAKAAELISERVAGKRLSSTGKHIGGAALHYAFGAAAGALYAYLNELSPIARAGRGVGWGATVWALGDQLAVPASGLSKKPTEYPLSNHLYGFAAHCVYGLALYEATRRIQQRL